MHEFDAGPKGVFQRLCKDYPGEAVYSEGFRTQWGPIFYRGRLSGSARLLVIGQDPAQHEAVLRRILAGEAGRRVQGFVRKLGFTKSYVMVNAFLYGIYDQRLAFPHLDDAEIGDYRHKWLDAILAPGEIDAVVAFGAQAHKAWQNYRRTPSGRRVAVAYEHVLHPTSPGKGNPVITPRMLLENWNGALQRLRPHIAHPDVSEPFVPYGADFAAAELPEIPSRDLPAGIPDWMCREVAWALMADDAGDQRANIVLKVPPHSRGSIH
jgi:uracil-DNA glycosylase